MKQNTEYYHNTVLDASCTFIQKCIHLQKTISHCCVQNCQYCF